MRRTQRWNSDSHWEREYGNYQKNNYEHRQVTNYDADNNYNRKRYNKIDKRPYEHNENDHQLYHQDWGGYDNDRDCDGGDDYGDNNYFGEDENNNEDECYKDGEYVREFFSNKFRRRSECEGKDSIDEHCLYHDVDDDDSCDRNFDNSNANYVDNNNYEDYSVNNMRDRQNEISDQYYQHPREIICRVGNERSLSTSSKRIVIQNDSSVPVRNHDFSGNIVPLRSDDFSGKIVPLRSDDFSGKILPLRSDDSSGNIVPLGSDDFSGKKSVLKELGISLDDVKRFLNDDIVESADEAILKSSFIKMLREKVLDRDVVDEECKKIYEHDEAKPVTEEPSKKETRSSSYDGKGHNGRSHSVKYSLKTSNTTSRHISHSRDSKKEDCHSYGSQRSKRSRSRSPTNSHHYDRRETNSKHHSTSRRTPYNDEKRLSTRRYSREISSSDLKDSSIADFLKAAAESSLKETKKQQASRFIFNQFKIAQPVNFTQNLPVISQVYATSPTTHFPITNPHTVMIPQSPIIPQFCQLQASLTTSSNATNLSSVYPHKQSTSLPSVNNNIKMTYTESEEKLSNSSELKTSIDDELKLIRRSTNFVKTLPRSDENVDDKIESESDVTITRVVESKHKSTKRLLPFVRKVTVLTDRKNASNEDQRVLKTKARVPSWFNSRCIELFKKRHKKVQQLKQARKDNCDSEESIKEALRDIDREYIPLCKKTKSEYIQSSASNKKSHNPIENKTVS